MIPLKASPELVPVGGADTLPRHVAIIMDGNGRWAKARRLPRVAGHRRGVEAVRRIVRKAGEIGLEVLTLYAFSSENWRRPMEEVSDLMGLLRHFIRADLNEIAGAGVRIRVIGDYRAFQDDLVKLIDDAIARTAANTGMTLVIALNYGSHNEIARATRALAERARAGEIDPASITAEAITGELDTADIPPVDLLIRTSGERRLSNFLLWQAAYAELLFTDTLWPDFGEAELVEALDDFSRRERRFGGL
ncbi:isoprenyl transferase [Sphingomonas changbaiensis NBRC 104936]|uniref:Isoprenyl transferase n=1 Tax=Sphingomonas changbaiensis NBRC 104936 TaxID=1219043 RepID=A0A0E9MLX7_9SPHN|nr:isoprenyl transferase [Sphingomonas changbaiensis]GAO38503.1 isoprenyl transferase [Sphingomonas changbaiensis NBRC 104936]